jgi:hypothetical protein
MGFSSWPHDLTEEAVTSNYRRIQSLGDIVLEQLEEGVPWNEALKGEPFPFYYQELLRIKRARISSRKKLVVALNPLDTSRTKLAPYRTNEILQPLSEPWASYPLDHPNVKRAYFNYASRIIELMKPDYLLLGIEVNLLMRDNPSRWPEYLRLHQSIYRALKRKYPSLPLLVSVEAVSLFEGWNSADSVKQKLALKQLIPFTDILGVSLHPFMSGYTTGPYPFDLFKAIGKFSNKKLAITEASFPAENFTININDIPFPFAGTEEKQAAFVRSMLRAGQRDKYAFIIMFTLRDYDALWEKSGRTDQLLVWRDTGFYNGAGMPRQVLTTWQRYLQKRVTDSRLR